MNGQSSQKKPEHRHGLRLVKGGAEARTPATENSAPAAPKVIQNPLLRQLTALADALDADVQQILKL